MVLFNKIRQWVFHKVFIFYIQGKILTSARNYIQGKPLC